MRVFRRRARLRPLDERECYARLHGYRTGEIVLVPESAAPPPGAAPDGPTEESPALHLVIAYPRSGGTLTGEQVRRELLRRMRARAGEAA
ncbi:MAG TPA: hypothetical protein VD695_00270 [Gaiellaceae bacterium]|nr:hypothetical protein [Gaiellaceae bacterium]HXV94958.1 hypothetical protein [Gaiellaceae bacterium]